MARRRVARPHSRRLTAPPEIRVERLLGALVRDTAGRRVGRIEEIEAVRQGTECLASAYLLGVYGPFDRLSAWAIGRFVLDHVGGRHPEARRIPWQWLDLSDPRRPRLTGRLEELPPAVSVPREPTRAGGRAASR